MSNPTILMPIDYYLPAYKAGGPIRTLSNLVKYLGEEFTFKIITRNHDFQGEEPFQGILTNSWQKVGNALVLYLSPDSLDIRKMKKIITNTSYDLLYLNSFFSLKLTIIPLLLRRAGMIPNKPVILAPRGELSQGALTIKRVKKQIYIQMGMKLGVFNGIVWQASSPYEKQDIQKIFGQNARVMVAPDLATPPNYNTSVSKPHCKQRGSLKVVFLSRISRIKNLDGALKMLRAIKGDVEFNIYGPLEDASYWKECEVLTQFLPPNIKVNYHGVVSPNEVAHVFQEHDIFLFPTRSENFGHVVFESLCAGCPVLASDQTFWRELEENGAGWSIPLSDFKRFQDTLQQCVEMSESDFLKMRVKAREFAQKHYSLNQSIEAQRILFREALFLQYSSRPLP
jgi:glycosyltransferase involved in cell wall biosynthesis